MERFNSFLESIPEAQVHFVQYYNRMYHFEAIGELSPDCCTTEYVEQVIREGKPVSARGISTITNYMLMYAKYIGNMAMVEAVSNVDRKKVLEEIRKDGRSKKTFISHSVYLELCDNIPDEEYNPLIKKAMVMAPYEGIFTPDNSVLTNLRASDIRRSSVIVRPDNADSYEFEISTELASVLLGISKIYTWSKPNKYGVIQAITFGRYHDSCFKIIDRGGVFNEESLKQSFYKNLRSIGKEYCGYSITPQSLYISGIMHRVCEKMVENGFDPKLEFFNNEEHRMRYGARDILDEELKRCHYAFSKQSFKNAIEKDIVTFFEDGDYDIKLN